MDKGRRKGDRSENKRWQTGVLHNYKKGAFGNWHSVKEDRKQKEGLGKPRGQRTWPGGVCRKRKRIILTFRTVNLAVCLSTTCQSSRLSSGPAPSCSPGRSLYLPTQPRPLTGWRECLQEEYKEWIEMHSWAPSLDEARRPRILAVLPFRGPSEFIPVNAERQGGHSQKLTRQISKVKTSTHRLDPKTHSPPSGQSQGPCLPQM